MTLLFRSCSDLHICLSSGICHGQCYSRIIKDAILPSPMQWFLRFYLLFCKVESGSFPHSVLKGIGDNAWKVPRTVPGTGKDSVSKLSSLARSHHYPYTASSSWLSSLSLEGHCPWVVKDLLSLPLRQTHLQGGGGTTTKKLLFRADMANSDHKAGGSLPGATEPWKGRKTSHGGEVSAGKRTNQYSDKGRNFFCCCLER